MTHDAWNPGLSSDIPARLLPQVTLYRPENSRVEFAEAREAAEFCGLKPQDMVAFTPERLVIHELLIRVTADLSVPDGPNYEELGINLRGMVARIFEDYAKPEMASFKAALSDLRGEGERYMTQILEQVVTPVAEDRPSPGFMERLFGRKSEIVAHPPDDLHVISALQACLASQSDISKAHALEALLRVANGIIRARGRLVQDPQVIVRFALNIFLNTQGALEIGRLIEPILKDAAHNEGYRFLPSQTKPFIMNVKGASASGKSTIRPQQRALADKLGVPWEDFALISPDYWRKYLLDYDGLGEDYKYAAMMTGQELEIIDKKLDAYVAQKAADPGLPHLLIDRFRFDSFSADEQGRASSRLLTRFGDTVYLFFLITPPEATVERAWARGLQTGRYKAVDDLLFHNIEAYTGMPQLFLSWVGSAQKKIHFEFLDNSVAFGELPRTVAYGWNDRMVVIDAEKLHDIDRFRAVNVGAKRPEDVLNEAPSLTFLDQCLAQFSDVVVLDQNSGEVLRSAFDGRWQETPDQQRFGPEVRAADQALTLGAW